MPPKTPIKTPQKKALPPCPLLGAELVVPGAIFKTPSQTYRAVVTGWNSGSTDSVDVRFEDGDVYWFPLSAVEKWAADARAARPLSPGRGRAGAVTPSRRSAAAAAAGPPPASPAAGGRVGAKSPGRPRRAAAIAAAAAIATPTSPRMRRRTAAAAEAGGGGAAAATPIPPRSAQQRAAPPAGGAAAARRQQEEEEAAAAAAKGELIILLVVLALFFCMFCVSVWMARKVPQWRLLYAHPLGG
ncbi:MAG: hypothetical protein J3K34DRAFT_488735 [Monoraphidium minutum]|nr:MAG: hypothetical protein J3K34DRAFT_488735 [Monoraphidium minutum]